MQLYEWPYDFERDRDDVFLTIDGGLTSFQAAQLDSIALGMLESAGNPAIIAPCVERIDHSFRLCYPVTGLRQLAAEIRGIPPEAKVIYELLSITAGILERARDYLLNERCFVLNHELIFVGDRWTDLRLIYVPFHDLPMAPPVNEQLLQLVEAWQEPAEQLPLKAWREIQERLSSERFQLSELRRWCEDKLRSGTIANIDVNPPERDEPDEHVINPVPPQASEAVKQPNRRQFDQAEGRRSDHAEMPAVSSEPEPGAEPDYLQDLIPLEEATSSLLPADRTRKIGRALQQPAVLTAVVLGLATVLAYCFFFPFPGSQIIMYGLIGTFIVIIAGMLLWDRKKQREMTELPEAPDWKGAFDAFPGISESFAAAETESPRFIRAAPEVQTELLIPPERTELLAGSAGNDTKAPPRAGIKLIVSKDGQILKEITIVGERYTIGRGAAGCDYCSEQTGVSRMHCELVRQGNDSEQRYALKDLGSRNGTRLNDAVLIPFKLYPLQHGDRIGVLGETFEYREH
jgi:hypothetical protein